MKTILMRLLALLWLAAAPVYADWQPDPDNKREVAARKVVDRYLEKQPELEAWFDEAYGYAVFPRVLRAGAAWGGALGYGVVIENNAVVGRCGQYAFGLGPQLGAQTYQQIILFRTREVMEMFQRRGSLEFEGRASAAALIWGHTLEPAYLPDVAIISMTELGLMIEASANMTVFTYKPKVSATESPATE